MSSRAEEVFRRYASALRGFIRKQTSSQRSESEDLLQDIFYKFMVTDGEDEQIENVSAWLYRVARNLIVDRSRKIREQPMPYVRSEGAESWAEPARVALAELVLRDDSTPEEHLARVMIVEEFEAALAALPDSQRVVYELSELQGISFAEIAEATGIPINTLISRKRYAVQALRGRLEHLL